MRLVTPLVLSALVVPGCQDKSGQPTDASTSGLTSTQGTDAEPTTTIPVTTSTLATTMTAGTEPDAETQATDPTTTSDTGGGVPWAPVQCGDVMCKDDEVCHDPDDLCVQYEPEDTEVCDEYYGCYEIETRPPVCAAIPTECKDAPDLAQCIVTTLCGDDGCFGNYFDEGQVDCSSKFCHCP